VLVFHEQSHDALLRRVGGPRGEQRLAADKPARLIPMVERLVYLGPATQVILRLAAGAQVQVLVQNDGGRADLSQGTPVHVYLAPDALRVLAGDEISETGEELEIAQAG